MDRKIAYKNYSDNWDREFTTLEALYERIRILSENGAYRMCIYIDSKKEYNDVLEDLIKNGYSVEHYNGGNNNILEIDWG